MKSRYCASDLMNHGWNIVTVDGVDYHVDVTWDDAGNPENDDEMHYAWFNVTTERILRDHKIQQDGYAIPTCTATDFYNNVFVIIHIFRKKQNFYFFF